METYLNKYIYIKIQYKTKKRYNTVQSKKEFCREEKKRKNDSTGKKKIKNQKIYNNGKTIKVTNN